MKAVVAGHTSGGFYVHKCSVCGNVVSGEEPETCGNCGTLLEPVDWENPIRGSKVCLDMHGVVFDVLNALRAYIFAKDHKSLFNSSEVTDYDFHGDIGVSREDVFAALKDPTFYGQEFLHTYAMADFAVKYLSKFFAVQVYTGDDGNPGITDIMQDRIKELGLTGEVIHGRKPVIYDACALFDDNVAVHRQWFEAGYQGLQYLIDQPYNQPKRNERVWGKVIRVSSLFDGVIDLLKRGGIYGGSSE